MTEYSYWHQPHETMPRARLETLQLSKLRRVVGWALQAGGLQGELLRRAGIVPGSLTSITDIRRIPFLTRDAWMASQQDVPPYGDLLAAPDTTAMRCHLTSGTSGRSPLYVLDGMKDWEWISEMWCYAFWGFGVRPEDRVFVAFGYGSFIGFWGAHYAAEKLGCLVLPGGGLTTEARLRQIVDLGVTVVCATPTYALRLAEEARLLGIDLANTSVRRIILSGEPAGSIPATKRLIESEWDASVADTAGMTELGTIMMFECEAQPGGCHIIEDHYFEEVVDPVTGEPVPYGVQGERVVTSFGRGFIPVLRYRTRDLVVRLPGETCACGRTWDIYDGGIRGRVDDMKLVRGTNVYPRAIEAVVREFAVNEFQIHLYTADGIRDEIEVLVELADNGRTEHTVPDMAKALTQAIGGLRVGVREVGNGTLPRFELKARRVRDERVVIGSGVPREAVT